jgi:hypothetical protein
MSRANTYNNADGLRLGYGRHTADNDVASVAGGAGHKKTMTLELDLTAVTTSATDANTPIQHAQIKRGSIITDAYIQTVVAATSGGAATLDLGLWGRGTLTTPVTDDANGLHSGVTIAQMTTVGEVIRLTGAKVHEQDAAGTPRVGTTVGATSLSDCVISAEWNTAAFTAGTVLVTVEYIEPSMSPVAAV